MIRFILPVCLASLAACGSTPPTELVQAREAYRHVSVGEAGKIAPAEVHIAAQALARAERAFEDDAESFRTRDLAYIAQRKAELAGAIAATLTQQKGQVAADKAFVKTQGEVLDEAKQNLDATQTALIDTARRASEAEAAKAAAEKRAADAQAALARLAAVKQEPRGVVITLSGSVLFASNQTVLLPQAQNKLNEVAEVLLTTRERNITIEGHTDSQGSDSHNMTLSQGRADAVRSYLVSRGYEPDRIKAHGLGEGTPVADNKSAEGRANNRRVEIIIAPEGISSN